MVGIDDHMVSYYTLEVGKLFSHGNRNYVRLFNLPIYWCDANAEFFIRDW